MRADWFSQYSFGEFGHAPLQCKAWDRPCIELLELSIWSLTWAVHGRSPVNMSRHAKTWATRGGKQR